MVETGFAEFADRAIVASLGTRRAGCVAEFPRSAIGAETSLRAKCSRGTIFAIIDLRTFACCDSFADLADVAVGPVQIRVLAGIAAPAE